MSRIPEEELNRIKTEIDLVALIGASGVKLLPKGKDFVGHCPFHEDKTPSLIVTPSKNLWHCMGACQTGGNPIDWMMKLKGIGFRHAVEIFREGKHTESLNSKIVKRSRSVKLPSPISAEADEQALLKQVIDYYHQSLKNTPDALRYLEKRGLIHPEVINTFKLGFADRSLGLRLPEKNRAQGLKIRGSLTELGIYRKTGHEHFNGSLVIPVLDAQQNIQEIYGRKIGTRLRKGTALHLYLPGEHKGIFNPACLNSDTIILCESLIDALSFWVCGFRNVTSSFGINGFTEEIFKALTQGSIKKVMIAYDSDEAGDKAAVKVAGLLSEKGINCFRVRFPHLEDANQFILKFKSIEERKEALLKLLNSAESIEPKHPQIPVQPLVEVPAPGIETKQKEAAKEETSQVSPIVSSLAADNVPLSVQSASVPTEKTDPFEVKGEEIHIAFGDRQWRVRGLYKNQSFEVLRVNLKVLMDDRFHVDTLDLYQSKPRAIFINTASVETSLKAEIIKRDLGKILLKLEEILESTIKDTLEPKKAGVVLSPLEKKEALDYLESNDLLEKIADDFEACGVAGERTNCQVGYLASISRKLEKPLAVIVQSSSSAGKSTLMESVLSFVPDEDQVRFTAMTGQSLFYMGEKDLVHKILAISEEEGAERAQYAIKTLQSEQRLKIASTGKDPKTGKLQTNEYTVEGPTQLMLTTTNVEIDEELQNRCLILSVDESKQQTEAIHRRQREMETLQGLIFSEKRNVTTKLHQNVQRTLEPLAVVNPYAKELNFPSHLLRLRRDHAKYLCLIRCIALLHQHQRKIKYVMSQGKQLEYIEVEKKDIALANGLMNEILGESLDELSPHTRNLLKLITQMVKNRAKEKTIEPGDVRFTRREIREFTGWGNSRLKIHLHRLEEMEYLSLHQGKARQRFIYELLYGIDEKKDQSFILKLTIPSFTEYDESGQNSLKTGQGKMASGQGVDSPRSGQSQGGVRFKKSS